MNKINLLDKKYKLFFSIPAFALPSALNTNAFVSLFSFFIYDFQILKFAFKKLCKIRHSSNVRYLCEGMYGRDDVLKFNKIDIV